MIHTIEQKKQELKVIFKKLAEGSLIYLIYYKMISNNVLDSGYIEKLYEKVMEDRKKNIRKRGDMLYNSKKKMKVEEDRNIEAEKILDRLLGIN